MPDWIAIWGAVTGTLAVTIAGRRELILNRARLGMQHGAWFSLDADPDLDEARLTIQIWNDGGQPLTIEHVGVHLHPIWDDVERELVVVDERGTQVEIELEGAQVEMQPGGPSRTFYAPLVGLIQAGIDVLEWPGAAWVRTSDQKVWRGKVHPVVPGRVPDRFRREIERMQSQVAIGLGPQEAPTHVRLPSHAPSSERGVLYG